MVSFLPYVGDMDATLHRVWQNMRPRHAVLLGAVGATVALGLVVVSGGSPAGERATGPHTPGTPASPTSGRPAPPATTTIARAGEPAAAALPVPPPLGWSECDSGRQCSTLVVPLDYADPGGEHIGIALERRLASDPAHRIGSLILNPGGPGESGLLNLSKDLSVLPAGVLEHFDVVAFDPRGIGASEGIHCVGDTYNGPEPDPVPQTPAAEQTLLASDRAYAQSCARSAGALLAHVGTLDVARDLEELRQALGDAGLNYLGLSYGTLLGATYASLFPTHIRAMVLDGALDPSLTTADLANAQALGFENSLDAFFAWCSATPGSCAWRPVGDPHAAFQTLAASVRAHPLAVGTQTVGPNEFYTGTFGTLYAQSFWPSLGRALAGVASGSGSAMLGLYDGYERVGDPSFDGDANNAVTCLDHPVPTDPNVYFQRAATAAEIAPDFGPLFAWGALSCAVWPVPAADQRVPAPVRAAGSPPILVVGTTGDPATPYAWARSLASQLEHGVLLTRVGLDHVAIFYSSCVRSWDDAYLENLQTPPPGTVCAS